MPYCSKCKKIVGSEHGFCTECGASFSQQPTSPAPPQPNGKLVNLGYDPESHTFSGQTRPMDVPAQFTPPEEKVKLNVRLILVLATVVLIVVGIIVVLIFTVTAVGVGPGGTPLYAGMTENKEAEELTMEMLENGGVSGLSVGVYHSSDNVSTVTEWYETEMEKAGWTQDNQSESYNYNTYQYTRGGVVAVLLISSYESGNTPVIIFSGSWSAMENLIASYFYSIDMSGDIAGDANGFVYDQDQGAGENYTNGKLHLTVKITQGRLRNVDDTIYGFTVSLTNGRSGWNMSFDLDNKTSGPLSGVSGTLVFGGTYTWPAATEPKGTQANWTARITLDSQHRWATGSYMIVELDNLYWNPAWTNLDNVAWRDADTISITLAGRDTLSLTGFSGAYLSGTRIG